MTSQAEFLDSLANNSSECIIEHTLKLINNLLAQQQSGKYCDVSLQCTDGIITAHSLILMSTCESLFKNSTSLQPAVQRKGMGPHYQNSTTLPMTQYPMEVVQMMINYLYTGATGKHDDKHSKLLLELMAEYELIPSQSEQKCTLQTRCGTLLIHLMSEV